MRMAEDRVETFIKPRYISEFRHQEQFKVYKKHCLTARENSILILLS